MPATATREQAGIQSSTGDAPRATVTYDSATSEISLNVVVSLPPGATEPSVFAVPFTVPPGPWTVKWNLEPGPGLSSVIFPRPEDGVEGIEVPGDQLPPVPPNVSIGDSQRNSDTQWQVDFTNSVRTVNSFRYNIGVIPMTTSNKILPPVFVHDPSIAVTPDPIT